MVKKARKESTPLTSRIRAVLFGVFAIIFFGWVYAGTSLFQIDTYDIQGIPKERAMKLEDTIRQFEREPILGILRGDSTVLYHKKAILRTVYEQLPNVKSVIVVASHLHVIHVAIVEYTPVFKMDEGEAATVEGVTYKEIHDVSALPTLIVASTSSLTQEALAPIVVLYPKISATLFPVKVVFIDAFGDVHLKGGEGMSEVIVDGKANIDKTWSTIVSAIDTDPLKSNLSSNKGSLLYIDARFGNKIFYKFTNGSGSSIIDKTYASSTHSSATTTSH
jgi:hypothetical protein